MSKRKIQSKNARAVYASLGIANGAVVAIVLSPLTSGGGNENIGYFFIELAAYGSIAIFASIFATILTVIKTKTFLLRDFLTLTLPPILTALILIPIGIFIGNEKSEYIEKMNLENSLGEFTFITLDRDGLPSYPPDIEWEISLASTKHNVKSETHTKKPNVEHHGFMLGENNTIKLRSGNKSKLFPIPKPDYKKLTPIVRLDEGSGAITPPHAWAFPQQIDTLFFIYKNHIETAPTLSRLMVGQEKFTTPLKVFNFTGVNIRRIRVNGWELSSKHGIEYANCESAATMYIPEVISDRLKIEWQYENTESWKSATFEKLPSMPPAPDDAIDLEDLFEVKLNHKNVAFIKRGITFKDSNGEHHDSLSDSGYETIYKSDDNYFRCTPREWNFPGNIKLYNMTKSSYYTNLGDFKLINSMSKSYTPNNNTIFIENFNAYKLKKQLNFKLIGNANPNAVRHIVIQQPNYKEVEYIIKNSNGEISSSDFLFNIHIYNNHSEGAYAFSRHNEPNNSGVFSIELLNLSGRDIARVEINGIEVEDPRSDGFFYCSSNSYYLSVPKIFTQNIIRWKYDDDSEWQMKHVPSAILSPRGVNVKTRGNSGVLYVNPEGMHMDAISIPLDKNQDSACIENNCYNHFINKMEGIKKSIIDNMIVNQKNGKFKNCHL